MGTLDGVRRNPAVGQRETRRETKGDTVQERRRGTEEEIYASSSAARREQDRMAIEFCPTTFNFAPPHSITVRNAWGRVQICPSCIFHSLILARAAVSLFILQLSLPLSIYEIFRVNTDSAIDRGSAKNDPGKVSRLNLFYVPLFLLPLVCVYPRV